jgi:hypothetical protein
MCCGELVVLMNQKHVGSNHKLVTLIEQSQTYRVAQLEKSYRSMQFYDEADFIISHSRERFIVQWCSMIVPANSISQRTAEQQLVKL